ncbi:MAG: RNA 2'-phosphotransferase [Candidatus Njordarchaeales archaeon]
MPRNSKMISLSKFLSLLLRHRPDLLDLKMRKDGFVRVEELLRKVRKRPGFGWVTEEDIKFLVKNDPKQRFELKYENGELFIRARYGHSKALKINVRYNPVKLGKIKYLYHGTRADVLPWILREGLKPMARKYVHLSPTPADAMEVAKRRKGKPVILQIDVEEFLKDGGKIWKATEKVYLAKEIPPKYIKIYKYGYD